MNNTTLFISNIPSCLCLIGACALALNDISGWGWFLFVGCISACTPKYKKTE